MKVRKMVASLAALSMLAAFSAQAVAAADKVTISAEKVSAKAGSEFTLNVELGDVPAAGISVCEFALTYDPTVVTVSSVTPGAIAENGVDTVESFDDATAFSAEISTEGLVTIMYSTAQADAAYCITESGVYAVISGTIAADAKDGEYPISIVPIERETTQGSGVTNSELKAGYIGEGDNPTVTKYEVAAKDGAIVIGDGKGQDTTGGADGVTLYGDVDVDGDVDIVDVIALNKNLMMGEPLSEQGTANADVDRNGSVNATDSLNILKAVVKIVTLPV